EQCCYLLQQLSGPRLHPPLEFTKPSDVALQMGPTELAARHRPNIVGRQAVGTQHPLEPSQQRTQRRLIAPSSNSEHGADPANRDPQPTPLTRLLPTGLVGIRDLLPRQRLLYLLISGLQGGTDGLAGGGDTAQRHIDAEQIVQQAPHFAFAEAKPPVQQRYQREEVGPKG